MQTRDASGRDVDNLRYSLLFSAIEPLLARPKGEPLSEDETRKLEMARAWLSDVVDGARLVTTGRSNAVSARRAVDALVYALSSLEAMELISSQDDDGRLRAIVTALDTSVKEHRINGPDDALRDARELFEFLNRNILSEIKRESMRRSGRTLTQLT